MLALTSAEIVPILEAFMIACFGVSWPISIFKTLRARRVEGKSLLFLFLIFSGYLAGVAGKFLKANGGYPEPVTILYALNALLVGIDICLYLRFRPKAQPCSSEANRSL